MTHGEFAAAYASGRVRAEIEPKAAAAYLSARLLLPLVALPVLGIGVAAALTGWIYTGLAIIAAGFVAPRLIKRSAPRFLLQQALRDAKVYDEMTRAGLLRVASPKDEG